MQIAVIGAGVIGCAIAHELAARGARVTVFERRGVARGASWA
ncbi:MAG: FAD-dependent oxidoreductase, partial [Acidobacteriota bacterium]|nr:FAD-dependent oxidoreductase [Acidobacteriota bacterium]